MGANSDGFTCFPSRPDLLLLTCTQRTIVVIVVGETRGGERVVCLFNVFIEGLYIAPGKPHRVTPGLFTNSNLQMSHTKKHLTFFFLVIEK